jgi:hypothetical protein
VWWAATTSKARGEAAAAVVAVVVVVVVAVAAEAAVVLLLPVLEAELILQRSLVWYTVPVLAALALRERVTLLHREAQRPFTP